MKQKIYAIRDAKVGAYMTPFFSHNNDTALRSFRHAGRSPESVMNSAPDDFALYCLGEFDDSSGKIIPLDTPDFVGNLSKS